MTIVDTPVWSLAFRRSSEPTSREQALVNALRDLITVQQAILLGPIRQEVLSGLPEQRQFDHIRGLLADFPDVTILPSDYVLAAQYSNLCRAHGVLGSSTDLLICAIAVSRRWTILTTDRDFERYAKHLPIRLTDLPR